MSRDYYAVLGIRATATAVEVRRAYQRLARQYSPDVNLWDDRAGALFTEIAEAYRVLSDPSTRRLYDGQAAPGSRPEADSTGTGTRASGRRGDDLTVPLELAFQQAMTGFEMTLPVMRLSPCRECVATGVARGGTPVPCTHCDGLGTIWVGQRALRSEPCPLCDGAGLRVPEACPRCRGRGVTPEQGVVRLTVPQGVDTGTELRVPGQGHAGPFGGPRGDLVVMTRVHEEPAVTRKGDNFYCEVSVTVVEAALGARILIQGVEGRVELSVPAGTQSGQTFRLRGRGMPRLSGGRGDLYVSVRVETPQDLDARCRDLLLELGQRLPAPPVERRLRAAP
jgi:molecular chaperone DnaJ